MNSELYLSLLHNILNILSGDYNSVFIFGCGIYLSPEIITTVINVR